MNTSPPTILCLASYEKGHEFLRELKRSGSKVVLLTSLSLEHKASWPSEAIDEIFYMPDKEGAWDRQQTLEAVSFLARTRVFSRIVALDDFDVETGAMLREHLRLPGMGETKARYFRDKLAMRMKAREVGGNVPEFIHVLNHEALHQFMQRVPAPWVLKPRSMAGAIGIKKIHQEQDFWRLIEELGNAQSYYLLEEFIPGDVFHVDTIVSERVVKFAISSGYGRPPMEVSHEGGIFTTRILNRNSEEAKALLRENNRIMAGFELSHGLSHTEFIRAHRDGQIYFLETSARVGGAHIADLVQAATGINLWAEWAKVETLGPAYQVPHLDESYAALIVSLARQEHPDTSGYVDPEIVWRMDRPHHVGLVIKSPGEERVQHLLNQYVDRIRHDFHAAVPPLDRPTA
jgi:hypothetical protein